MEGYITQIIATVVTLVLLYITRFVISKLVVRYGHILQVSELRTLQTKQVISTLLNIVFVFIIAIIWGVEPHNLLIGLSSIFAVIGVAMFAQWSILSNITAGIIMFFTAPFRIGDRIRIIDKDIPIDAVIENIHTFYTHIRTDDDELIVLPNSLFLQKIVSIKKDRKVGQ